MLTCGDHRVGKLHRARAALSPMVRHDGVFSASANCRTPKQLDLPVGIVFKSVYGNNGADTESTRILNHLDQVARSLLE